jgi:hypothetical protein
VVEPIFRPRARSAATVSSAPGMKSAKSGMTAAFIGVKTS